MQFNGRNAQLRKQEHQRVAVVDPGSTRCRPTRSRHAAAAAATAAAGAYTAALGNLLIKN